MEVGTVVEGGAELLVQRTSLRPAHCREPMHAPWNDAKRVVDLEMATRISNVGDLGRCGARHECGPVPCLMNLCRRSAIGIG
jgi:hypothetical protein